MFLFDYFKQKKDFESGTKFVKKIIVSANDEASFNKIFWISDAEVLMKVNYNFNESEERTMTLSELEDYIINIKDSRFSCRVIKTFAYREPVLFMPEIWHDMELEEYNKRLRDLAYRKHFAKK